MKCITPTGRAMSGVLISGIIATACNPVSPTLTLPRNLTASADSVRAVWDAELLLPKQRMRDAEGCGGCEVRVDVWAVKDNYKSNPKKPPTDGIAVMKVRNRGNFPTTMYGFKPGVDTYFVISKDGGGNAIWSLVELPTGGTVTVRPGGPFAGCGHLAGASADADFKTCADAVVQHRKTNPAGGVLTLATTAFDWVRNLVRQPGAEPPAWISCTDGCCTMSTQ